MKLSTACENAGFHITHPCAGNGTCLKCAVEVIGKISPPTQAEMRSGCRLSCQTVLLGDATVTLPQAEDMSQIQTESTLPVIMGTPMKGKIGAAVDIGTTTIAVRRYDLHTGKLLGESSTENPQISTAADVIGRIDAAMNGKLHQLQSMVLQAIDTLLDRAGGRVDSMVVMGNTTMLYLLTGRDPACLSRVPFEADCLFDCEEKILEISSYLPPSIDAFVGADISCAVLAADICSSDKISVLCDIGTNGEVALWKNGTLHVTSTAAGPAFEGAGISSGCSSINGAIDKAWAENDRLCFHTIGDAPAMGICGSGIVDVTATLLKLELLDETGALDDDIELAPGITLTQRDIRKVQLAKAAISAGIRTLLTLSQTSFEEVDKLYIAGGFGSHLDISSAVAIGLIPKELEAKVSVIGNAALAGAAGLLLDTEKTQQLRQIVLKAKPVNLGGNPTFSEKYVEQILFPSTE